MRNFFLKEEVKVEFFINPTQPGVPFQYPLKTSEHVISQEAKAIR